ncbi:hypothetical protein NC796_25010 [Aliifodinibius sp. S!AR15-10]|uniref:hypothetical protein n=1 Tax=Aliifodinibius sp. S!AR15-10 TaxID=2950437 RepID=UPI002860D0C9|nr:hypothetical protein [Aliifodinibius sp. S!AR15-10]MDR8394430.1 hypothetical protein [Aliifodinibius sp. S!AR15-10]
MNKRLVKITLVSILTVGLVVAAFYWNEACKEIVFLCGNFKKGVPEQSVHRQLDTGNLLRYRTEKLASGKRIIVDSAYNLSLYKCIIDIDESGLVIESRIE